MSNHEADSFPDIVGAALRSVNSNEGFDELSEAWLAIVSSLSPDERIRLAPEIRMRCRELVDMFDSLSDPEPDGTLQQAVMVSRMPTIVTSLQFEVLAINEPAAQELGLGIGSRSDMRWLSSSGQDSLREIIRRPLSGAKSILESADGDRTVIVEVVDGNAAGGRHLIFRLIQYSWNEHAGNLLKAAFALTDAEVDVARGILEHAEIDKIAATRNRSVRTVRAQLHSIYQKTGFASQTGLLRLVCFLCAEGRETLPRAVWRDPLDREVVIHDDDGQRIAFTWFGDPEGTPAMLVHGPLTGNLLPSMVQDRLTLAGIKVYSIYRPGFGSSEPGPSGDASADGAKAILAVAKALSLQGIAGIALVNGLIPLARASAQAPGMFSKLLCCGATIPMGPEILAKMPTLRKLVLHLANDAPDAFDLLFRSGYRAARRSGIDFIMRRLHRGSIVDLQTVFSEPNYALLNASVSMVIAQGPDAFAHDMRMSSDTQFAEDLARCAPLRILAGREDTVYPIAEVSRYAAKAGFELLEVPNAAQTVYLSHPELVADEIIATVKR